MNSIYLNCELLISMQLLKLDTVLTPVTNHMS